MPSFGDYKGLQVTTTDPVGPAGLVINDNFKEMADRVGPVHSAASAPTANDDGNNTSGSGTFEVWSKWKNTSSNAVYICIDNSTGAAVWVRLNNQSANELLTSIKTVDGSGSGLDADFLDGMSGSSYEQVANKNQPDGYAGLNASGHLVGPLVARTGTASELAGVVPLTGEFAYASDTKRTKVGDGVTDFSDLPSLGLDGGVWRISRDGSASVYLPSADTAPARGAAFEDALADLQTYDVLILGVGNYELTAGFTIDVANVTIKGHSLATQLFWGNFGSTMLTVDADDIRILDCDLVSTWTDVVDVNSGSVELRNCRMETFSTCLKVISGEGSVYNSELVGGSAVLDVVATHTISMYQTRCGTGSIFVYGTLNIGGGCEYDPDNITLDVSGTINYTDATPILESIKTVDGSGSGLDSDTVDGIESHTLMMSSMAFG